MVNLTELCAEMERSQRHLTPRAARDWWTKGLLPRPRRHGLGRQKGTETFWVESRVLEQAKATHDLLARHSRAYTALIGLWLFGFPIELKLVRTAWMKLIVRNQPRQHRRAGDAPLGEAVGELAARLLGDCYGLNHRRTSSMTQPMFLAKSFPPTTALTMNRPLTGSPSC
jgi:hypothetical protein